MHIAPSLRRIAVGLGLAGLMGAFAASTTARAGGSAGPRIAWLGNDPTNTYDNATLAGIEEVAATNGGCVDPFYAEFDAKVQLEQCRSAVRSGLYDALVVEANDPVGIEDCVKAARAASIPVAATDLPIGSDQTTVVPQVPGEVAASFIPASEFGDGVVTIVQQVCSGLTSCDILYLAGDETFPLDQYGVAAVQQVAATDSSVHLVLEAQADYDTPTAQTVTAAALVTYPQINVVIASGDQMALGAEEAGTSANHPLVIVGAGAGASAIAAVRAGRWFATFDALPRTEGVLGGTLVLTALRNPGVRPVGVDPVAGTGLPAWWTQSTLAQYPDFVAEWPGP